MIGNWRVVTAAVSELEAQLNALAADGYAVFSVLTLGSPNAPSNIPRERRTLEERTTVTILACKPQ